VRSQVNRSPFSDATMEARATTDGPCKVRALRNVAESALAMGNLTWRGYPPLDPRKRAHEEIVPYAARARGDRDLRGPYLSH